MKTLGRLTALCAVSLLSVTASAKDAVRLEEHEEKGYFDKIGRVGVYYNMTSGDRPHGGNVGNVAQGQDYKRSGYGIDFDLLGFWDAMRFDTLIGAEWLVKLGQHKGEKADDSTPEDGSEESRWFFRTDAAFDYGLIHWGGAIKGRISGGAGFGMDFDGGRWYAPKGRTYPLLLARAQFWISDSIALHGAYHFLPTTGSDHTIREHRFEGAAGIGPLQAGLRLVLTSCTPQGRDERFSQREMGAFVAFAF